MSWRLVGERKREKAGRCASSRLKTLQEVGGRGRMESVVLEGAVRRYSMPPGENQWWPQKAWRKPHSQGKVEFNNGRGWGQWGFAADQASVWEARWKNLEFGKGWQLWVTSGNTQRCIEVRSLWNGLRGWYCFVLSEEMRSVPIVF